MLLFRERPSRVSSRGSAVTVVPIRILFVLVATAASVVKASTVGSFLSSPDMGYPEEEEAVPPMILRLDGRPNERSEAVQALPKLGT